VTCRTLGNDRIELTVVVDGPSTNPKPPASVPEGEEAGRPRIVIEVIRHKTIDGIAQEETVRDCDGKLALCEEWSSASAVIDGSRKPNGIFIKSDAGYHWSSLFTLPSLLEQSGWSVSVIVRETRQFARAQEGSGTPQLADTGPVFLARIPIKGDTACTPDQPKK
jgi:hypothetical protein